MKILAFLQLQDNHLSILSQSYLSFTLIFNCISSAKIVMTEIEFKIRAPSERSIGATNH